VERFARMALSGIVSLVRGSDLMVREFSLTSLFISCSVRANEVYYHVFKVSLLGRLLGMSLHG
jgi:hypothetical protein